MKVDYYVGTAKRARLEQMAAAFRTDPLVDADGRPSARSFGRSAIVPLGICACAGETDGGTLVVDDCDYCADIREPAEGDELSYAGSKAVYCGYFHGVWGHFLMNTTSRLWYALRDDCDADYLVLAVAPGDRPRLSGNFREFLRLLGVLNRILIIDRPTVFASVEVPAQAFVQGERIAPEFSTVIGRVVKAALAEQGDKGHRPSKIMLTRSRLHPSSRSHDLGIGLIDRFFERAGYEIVAPEQMPLAEFIAMMHSAVSVAAIAGSAAHNVVFCPPATDFIIVDRMAHSNFFQPACNIAARVDVTHIDCALVLRPVNIGLGPWLYYPTAWLAAFAADRGWPVPEAVDARELRRLVKRYIRLYRRFYGEELFLGGWRLADGQVVAESVVEANKIIGPVLRGMGRNRIGGLMRKIAGRLLRR